MIVRVNGNTVGEANANKWLERNHRTFTIPGFMPAAPAGPALPVWMDLGEDDIFYDGDDQGDVNNYDARNAVVRAYTPGTVEQRLVKGGKVLGGRRNWGGDKAQMTYKLETFDTTIPQPPPPPMAPDLTFTVFAPPNFTVKNIGNAPAGPFSVQIIPGGPPALTYDFPGGLAPGASATMAGAFGCYTSAGTIDYNNQVVESNEANNAGTYAPEVC